ncbi:flagellar biosynthesis protein FlhB [Tumebacillus sp. DT12]|uniref:Flagellar biosynthetic protein FlhB n=1 Tax=Tumebacillus lacus TaxID=2995335 RepID=A0ABT3WV28_9BACL|nr:flagellar biosynthesis protein FlhB [Tumebacillus lacus]MCX7568532.1 flagellar biosynthesis protein FlhB [Tumebacillus lacus]
MIRLDLQLFAEGGGGEKTEKATPKRRDDARKKGQVARSQELGQAIVLLVGLLSLKLLSGLYMTELSNLFRRELSLELMYELNEQSVVPLFLHLSIVLAKLIFPLMLVVLVIGGLVAYLQVGALFTLKPITPDFKKINPIQGFKQMFSMRSFVELIKSLLKMLIVGFIVYKELESDWKRVTQLATMEVSDTFRLVAHLSFEIFWKVGVALLVLAIFDLFYQRFDYEKQMKMSKQEIKEEFKQTEGSPEVRAKMKERGRQMAMRRMMADVPQADVVITNPTHFAIAIRYDAEKMDTPYVLAKGVDELAQRIKQVARDANVVLVENRPLAQTLYKTVEIGDAIPGELFQAVAEVLAYVYRLKGKA